MRGNLGSENLARRPVWQPGIFSEYFGMVGEREIDAESRSPLYGEWHVQSSDSVGLQVYKVGLKNHLCLRFCSGVLNSISTLTIKEWKGNGSRT